MLLRVNFLLGTTAATRIPTSLGAPVVDRMTADAVRLQATLRFPCNLQVRKPLHDGWREFQRWSLTSHHCLPRQVVKRFLTDSRGMTRKMENAMDSYSRYAHLVP